MVRKELISVVIPAYNEKKDIGKCLNSLRYQSYKNIEVIVVDDGSTDKTKEIVRKFKKVKLIELNHKGPGKARNTGARKAKGKILIFVDADMTFDKDYIKNLVYPILNDKRIIGTTHNLEIVKNTKNIWSRCWGKTKVTPENVDKVKIFRAIRKDKFLKFGGFDAKYGYADDQTFWFKYQIKPEVAKNTTCYHKNPETLKGVYKQSRWIGASLDNVFLNIPIIKYLMPFFMILLSPLVIPVLSIKKSYRNNDYIILPYMLVFMAARYFGAIQGVIRGVYLKKNFR